MEELGRSESSEKTIAVLGDRWWPQTAKQEEDRTSKRFLCNIYGKTVMGAQMLAVSPSGAGTVLRLQRDAWSMVKWLRQANKWVHAPPPLTPTVAFDPWHASKPDAMTEMFLRKRGRTLQVTKCHET